jgi:hypothetical protein
MLEMSVWQRLAQSILTRTSFSFGGSTCISSTVTGFPAPQHIAATIFIYTCLCEFKLVIQIILNKSHI